MNPILAPGHYLDRFLRNKIVILNLVLMAVYDFFDLLVDLRSYIAGIIYTVFRRDPSSWVKMTLHGIFSYHG